MEYSPIDFWKNELGGVKEWADHASTSPQIQHSIHRTKTVIVPEISKLKNADNTGYFLDAGCGSGYASKIFLDSGEWAGGYGIDFQQHRIDYCNEKYNDQRLKFMQGNLKDTKLPDKSVNMIYTGAVLQHIPLNEKILVIQEFKRILTDDGMYFGHEVINDDSVGITYHGHIINVNMQWLRNQFNPFFVDEINLRYSDYKFQIIYAHK